MPSFFFLRGHFNFFSYSNIIKKTEDGAVSPVIGIILMVAITVILASVIAFLVFSFGGMNEKGPVASIRVSNNANTGAIDMKIVHGGGEKFMAGDWKISIVEVPDPPEYVTASSDLMVGDQIITTNLTNSGFVTVTNRSITSDLPTHMESGGKYDVKIIVFPYKTMTVDAVIIVQ